MRPRKRIFLGLVLFTLTLSIVLIFYAWILTFGHVGDLHRLVLIGISIFVAFITLLMSAGLGFIIFALLRKRTYPRLHWLIEQTIVLAFPIVVQLGRVLRIAQDKIQRSFIEVNNQLVRCRSIKIKPERLLLLLPHCLQRSDCLHKITRDPENCRRCGNCTMSPLLELCHRYRVQIMVVTGGTLAREAVHRARPKMVLAVACERDLSSGVIDSFPFPVYGILNMRPEGPCHNTGVDLEKVEKAIKDFIKR